MSNNINVENGLGVALLFIAFWGEPDLVDVIIKLIERMP